MRARIAKRIFAREVVLCHEVDSLHRGDDGEFMAPMSPDTACSMSILQLLASGNTMVSGHGMLSKSILFVMTTTRRHGESYALPHSRNSGSTYRFAVHSGRPTYTVPSRRDKTSAFCSVSFHGHWPRVYRQALIRRA